MARQFRKDAVDSLQNTLNELPEKTRDTMSARESVQYLSNEIQSALMRGYTLQEITEIMRDNGIELSAGTVRSYLTRRKRPARSLRMPKKQGRVVESSSELDGEKRESDQQAVIRAKTSVRPDTEDL